MRQSWSDDRLDHLNDRVDAGFGHVEQRFDRVEAEAREFRSEVNHRLDKLEDRFYAMHRTMIQIGGGLIGTMVLAFGGAVAAQL